MATNTPNFNFILPEVGSDVDVWGGMLNSNWTDTDTELKATNDAVAALTNAFHPVGAILITIDDVNPSTRIAGTTWILDCIDRAIIGAGNLHIGGADVGADEKLIDETNLPAHVHSIDPPATNTDTEAAHSHNIAVSGTTGGSPFTSIGANSTATSANVNTDANGAHDHVVDIDAFDSSVIGGDVAFNVQQASRAYYIWRRTI